MMPTSRLSAWRNALGMKPTASTASVISSSGEAICGLDHGRGERQEDQRGAEAGKAARQSRR